MVIDISPLNVRVKADEYPFWSGNDFKITYTLYGNRSNAYFHFLLWSRFEWEPLELHKQMVPHFLAVEFGIEISQAQLCIFIRGCHATFLVKSVLFTWKFAWQPLTELHSCSWNTMKALTRAQKWGIICLCNSSGSHSILLQSKKWKWGYHQLRLWWKIAQKR